MSPTTIARFARAATTSRGGGDRNDRRPPAAGPAAAAAWLAVLVAAAGASAGPDVTIVATRRLLDDGTIGPGGAVACVGGRIGSLSATAAAGAIVHRYPEGAVLSPGLIDLGPDFGPAGRLAERSASIDPGVDAADALDPSHPWFAEALHGGVTAALVLPEESSIFAGVGPVVSTRPTGGEIRHIRPGAALAASVGPTVWNITLGPTSRAGVLTLARAALDDAKAGATSTDANLRSMLAGRLPVFVDSATADDAAAAMSLLAGYGVRPVLVQRGELSELAPQLGPPAGRGQAGDAGRGGEAGCTALVVGPFEETTPARVASGPAAAGVHDIDIAFAGADRAGGLRTTARIAVRYGMDAAAARRGLTSAAARIAGAADRIGAISPGLDADLVVFSADPLRADAVVLAVYVRGERVFLAPGGPTVAGGLVSGVPGQEVDRAANR